MQLTNARSLAQQWVEDHRSSDPGFVGAFLTGSALEVDPAGALPVDSDLDVVVVTDRVAPPDPEKLLVRGVRLDVSRLSAAALADPAVVARTHWLAPSFRARSPRRTDPLLADPHGRLAAVRAQVAPMFDQPGVVLARRDSVEQRLRSVLASVAGHSSWPAQVLSWAFGTSLVTHMLLVSGLRNPTVRLRYVRVGELLEERGLSGHLPVLFGHLGCRDLSPEQVRAQLPTLADGFDAAALVNRASVVGSHEIVASARPVAVSGTERLVSAGLHREAVFWMVVTLARSQLVLEADADPALARAHRTGFDEAVRQLVGLRGPQDLVPRTADVLEALPHARAAAEQILRGTNLERYES